MKKKSFKISVVIPVQLGKKVDSALEALKKVNYPPALIEVFISYGFSPSRQRNEAVRQARGDILYFLDNDSEVHPLAFKRVTAVFGGGGKKVKIFKTRGFSLFPEWLSNLIKERFFSGIIYRGEIGAVGGPNVWRRRESFWASLAGIILESFFSHYKMAARYRPIGEIHRSGEKELILCNLAVRRDVFKRVGGFNEFLYPNEENELLNRIEKEGYQLVYHPGILVFRPRRESFSQIISAFLHYGRGRMEQIRIEGVWQSLPLLMPLFLFFYLLGLIFYHPWVAFFPLVLYFAMGFGSALGFAIRKKVAYLAIILPLFFLIVHLTYGLGLFYGLFSDLEKKKVKKEKKKIQIVKIKSFGENWEI